MPWSKRNAKPSGRKTDAAAADFIISRDHDLLDLMSGHDDDSKEFRQRFRPLKVITPETLLAEVERSREQG